MKIPMVDLKGQLKNLRSEIESGFQSVLDSTQFVLGPNGAALEEEIAAYCGVAHAVGVASGTDALHLALLAPERQAVQQLLAEAGIASAIYYPIPLHRQEVLRDIQGNFFLPVAEEMADRVLSLPMLPELTAGQREEVCQVLQAEDL